MNDKNKMALSAASSQQKMTRTDWKKEKELEEARKAGTAPALQDETGKDINPHIPQYISDAPWYYGASGPTLKHQRPQEEKQKQFAKIDASYKRGTKETSAIKYRKGACENCGAITHKKKDCLERPRRVGARFTGEDIKPDEYLPEQVNFDYDGKRDRWVGYDPEEHQRVLEEYQKMEMAKQQLKSDKLHQDLMDGKKIEEKEKLSDDDEEDEDKYADDVIIPGQKFDSKRRTTVRNLRIREDTAKYLYNLDPNSAHYDPKTRSMRTNPFGQKDIAGKAVTYQGDNFVRYSGDTQKMANTQLFAWEAYEKGTDVHLQADPTKLELLHREYKVKKEDFKQDLKGGILEKYGGEEHLNAPPKELLFAQTENYVEYSRTGEVVKGQEKAIQKSKYEEDVYINNHTSVWGSYWVDGKWGYGCCHSLIRGSYCTGDVGKTAYSQELPAIEDDNGREEKSLTELHNEKRRKEKDKKGKDKKDKREDSDELDKDKLKKALIEEEKQQKQADKLLKMDERKRSYNSLKRDYHEVTAEELEAYRIKRQNTDDPMSNFSR